MLARFINHHISPLNIEDSEVLEKAVLIAKHLLTVSCFLPRSLLFDARGSVSNFNAVPLKSDRVSNFFLIRRRLGRSSVLSAQLARHLAELRVALVRS